MNLSSIASGRVLWIEDAARSEYQDLITPIYSAGYDLTLAPDATQGIEAIQRSRFAAIIFDIRLPSGSHPDLKRYYRDKGNDPAAARLGLVLIRGLFLEAEALDVKLERPPWLLPAHCAVFSVDVDSLVVREMNSLGVMHCLQKRKAGSRRQVAELIAKITGEESDSEDL